MIRIEEAELTAGRALARSYIRQNGVKHAGAQHSLERFLGVYQAVQSRTENHDAALFIAASEARANIQAKPKMGAYKYPATPGDIFNRIDHSPEVLAGYYSFLSEAAAHTMHRSMLPAALVIDSKTYVLQQPVIEEPLVGLEHEQRLVDQYTRQLFLYEPASMSNPDSGRFPRTLLLSGPPGTGKSSLIKKLIASARKLEQVSGTRCTIEVYDASSFSSYFGKSTRILKQKLGRAADPGGVGIFCIEDADMVLQSRSDNNVFHGVLELQQYLMNHLSGLSTDYGNLLTVLSTNRPDSIDEALRSRMQEQWYVNPFEQRATHEAFFAVHLPQLNKVDTAAVASMTHSAGLAGRDLERIVVQAKSATTRAPTDAELRNKNSTADRYGTISVELLETLTASAGRRAAPHREA